VFATRISALKFFMAEVRSGRQFPNRDRWLPILLDPGFAWSRLPLFEIGLHDLMVKSNFDAMGMSGVLIQINK
tara:strand:- start:2069 stop:2287 length:219 start_codon:yes stop_codon:yes gene_type:complete